jgi:hypothetical protein
MKIVKIQRRTLRSLIEGGYNDILYYLANNHELFPKLFEGVDHLTITKRQVIVHDIRNLKGRDSSFIIQGT